MNYKLYTIGQSGDNFYLDIEKAEYELERRKAIGNTDCILQELEYLPFFEGKNSVIISSYYLGKLKFSHGYIIEEGECYGCDIDEYEGVDWLESNEQLEMVHNWYLGFEQMYPELIGTETQLGELKRTANKWIKCVLSLDGVDSLNEGIKRSGLNQELASIVRLRYVESCYLMDDIEEGDKYLQRVDLTLSHKTYESLDIYFKEVLELRNKKVKNNKGIILARFRN